jgi:hypothetical protein
MGDRRCAYRVLVGTPEGKRPLGRPRRRCDDNIEMGALDWIDLALIGDRWQTLVNAATNQRDL